MQLDKKRARPDPLGPPPPLGGPEPGGGQPSPPWSGGCPSPFARYDASSSLLCSCARPFELIQGGSPANVLAPYTRLLRGCCWTAQPTPQHSYSCSIEIIPLALGPKWQQVNEMASTHIMSALVMGRPHLRQKPTTSDSLSFLSSRKS